MKLISRGNTAELLEQAEHLVCKLFYPGYPKAYIEHELENAKAVFKLGIKTPRAYGLTCIDGRDGIIYEKVLGETLADKMSQAGEEELAVWTDRFAGMHRELLGRTAKPIRIYCDCRLFLLT